MECIFGIEHPDCGEIWLNGKKLSIRRVNDATSAGIAMVTEDRLRRGLIHKDTVEFNMSLAYLKKITKTGFVNRAKRAEDVSSMAKQMQVEIYWPESACWNTFRWKSAKSDHWKMAFEYARCPYFG